MPPNNRDLLDDINEPKENYLKPELIWGATYPDSIISQGFQKLLLKLNQSTNTDIILLSREISPTQPRLPPNPRTSVPASFLTLPSELRRRIMFQSAKSDWLQLLNGDMFKYGEVHRSYFEWLSECFEEWEWVTRRVDPAGRLGMDINFVVDAWWRALYEAVDERKTRELRDSMGESSVRRSS